VRTVGLAAASLLIASGTTWSQQAPVDAATIRPVRLEPWVFDQDRDDDDLETQARQRLAERLAELRKPVSQIRLTSAEMTRDVPTDLASRTLRLEAAVLVTSSDFPTPVASRVHGPMFHQPLYYEELNSERCGASHGYSQNLVSSWWFVFNTAVLPYRLATRPHCRCVPAGGDCPACHQYPTPIEPLPRNQDGRLPCRGIAAEAAVAGFTFLLLL